MRKLTIQAGDVLLLGPHRAAALHRHLARRLTVAAADLWVLQCNKAWVSVGGFVTAIAGRLRGQPGSVPDGGGHIVRVPDPYRPQKQHPDYGPGDYRRMGLPLEAIVIVVSIPMILLVWPF